MTEVEKIKAEIRRDGMRKVWGHELHDLIERSAVAAIRDYQPKLAESIRALEDIIDGIRGIMPGVGQ